MEGHSLKGMITDTFDMTPESFQDLNAQPEVEVPMDLSQLKDELEDLQNQLEADEMTHKFLNMTPEMMNFFESDEHLFGEGRLENFLVTLKQIRNKIKTLAEDLRKSVRKKQIPNNERIQLLVKINKEFKEETTKVEALITSAERMKELRDQLLSRGIDISKLSSKTA